MARSTRNAKQRARRLRQKRKKRAKLTTDSDGYKLPSLSESHRQTAKKSRAAKSLPLERGDLGIVAKATKSGRLPLSDAMRENVGEFLHRIMMDEDEPTRDRVRASQGLIASERINQSEDHAEDLQPEPPTIQVVNDPEYWKWLHSQSKQRRLTAAKQHDSKPSDE